MKTNPERERRQQSSEETPTGTADGTRRRRESGAGTAEQPLYVISIAAQILGVHPQTLRLYEREGLVEPQRSGGKIRLYSDRDIERVRSIMRLTNDLGVNLAGAEAILYMRERMLQLHEEMALMRLHFLEQLEELRRELDID
ncbi:MAG: MerR family transcriptional regulator [Chloroflexia bacterium]